MTTVYPAALTRALLGGMELDQGIDAYLITSDYVASVNHTSLSDVPAATREAVTELSNVQVTDGRVTADNAEWTQADGDDVVAVLFVQGNDLILYLDDFGAGPGNTTLDLNGSNITATWAVAGFLQLG